MLFERPEMNPQPFQHPASVPVPFALAVYAILHNHADEFNWLTLDKTPRDQALGWIREILLSNGLGANLENEMRW